MIALQEGEHIIVKARKRWFVIFTHACIMFMLAFAPILLIPQAFVITGMVVPVVGYIFYATMWVWFVWIMFVVMWTNYYLDVLILTNKRIIDREQFFLFSRDEVTIPIDRIEDIKIEIKGVVPTMFDFGDIQIQTAGAKRETLMRGVKNPEHIKASIDRLIQLMERTPHLPVEETQ